MRGYSVSIKVLLNFVILIQVFTLVIFRYFVFLSFVLLFSTSYHHVVAPLCDIAFSYSNKSEDVEPLLDEQSIAEII
jgi:hypothetical protein